jgi:hypothetical protein
MQGAWKMRSYEHLGHRHFSGRLRPSEKYDGGINWTRSAVPFPKNRGAENREAISPEESRS